MMLNEIINEKTGHGHCDFANNEPLVEVPKPNENATSFFILILLLILSWAPLSWNLHQKFRRFCSLFEFNLNESKKKLGCFIFPHDLELSHLSFRQEGKEPKGLQLVFLFMYYECHGCFLCYFLPVVKKIIYFSWFFFLWDIKNAPKLYLRHLQTNWTTCHLGFPHTVPWTGWGLDFYHQLH